METQNELRPEKDLMFQKAVEILLSRKALSCDFLSTGGRGGGGRCQWRAQIAGWPRQRARQRKTKAGQRSTISRALYRPWGMGRGEEDEH